MIRVHPLHTGDVRIDRALAHRTSVPFRFVTENPDAIVQFGHDPDTFESTSRLLRGGLATGFVGRVASQVRHAA